MVEATLSFVHAIIGLANVTVEANEPTSAPPDPWKVNVPPVEGIAVVLSPAMCSRFSPTAGMSPKPWSPPTLEPSGALVAITDKYTSESLLL